VPLANRSHTWIEGERVCLFDDRGQLVAVSLYDAARGVLQPRVMLAASGEGA
jgi:hypothetical protein